MTLCGLRGSSGVRRAPAAVIALALTATAAWAEAPVTQIEEVPIAVSARLEGAPQGGGPAELALGATTQLVIEVQAPVDAQVFVPQRPALGTFRLGGAPRVPPTRAIADGRAKETHRIPLVAMRLGAEAVPPIEIAYRLADGSAGSVVTERLRTVVRGKLDNEQDPGLAGAPPPEPVTHTDWLLIALTIGAGLGLLATIVTFFFLWVFRHRLARAEPPAPPRPANEVALEKLSEISTAELEAEIRYARLSDVLREYLGARYGFDGLESTTSELRRHLEGADLKTITPAEIFVLMDDADLVKFARMTPSEGDVQARLGEVKRIVEGTWEPPPEPEPDEDEVVALEPASADARIKAAAIDLGIALAFAAISGGTAALAAGPALGWTGLGVFALLLVLKDAIPLLSAGKVLLGLEVVANVPGQPKAHLGDRLLRNLHLLVFPLALPAELLVMLYHPERRRLGDLWVDTLVVQLDRSRRPASKAAPVSTPVPATLEGGS